MAHDYHEPGSTRNRVWFSYASSTFCLGSGFFPLIVIRRFGDTSGQTCSSGPTLRLSHCWTTGQWTERGEWTGQSAREEQCHRAHSTDGRIIEKE
jgi:hypothetical protein